MKWVLHPVLPILLVVLAVSIPTMAMADIFEWTDGAGVTHYTNLKATVPAGDQASLQVVVDEAARRLQVGGAGMQDDPAPPAPSPVDPSRAQLVQALYDQTQRLSAYLEGLQRGLDAGVRGTGGGVAVNAPVVVTGSGTVPDIYGYGGPYYGYGLPYYGGPYFGCGWPYFCGAGWPYFYPGVAVFSGHFGHFKHFGQFGHFGNFGQPGPFHKAPRSFGMTGGFGHSAGHGRGAWAR